MYLRVSTVRMGRNATRRNGGFLTRMRHFSKSNSMFHKLIVTLLSGLLLSSVGICEGNPEIWTSADGRKLEAKGLFWSPEGIYLKKASDGKVVLLAYDKLEASDAIRAVSNFPFETNNDVRLRAQSVGVSSNKVSVKTGRYYAVVDYYSYDGYSYMGTVTIRPETKSKTASDRSVEVELSSICGPGVVAVEFHVVAGKGEERKIESSECRVVRYEVTGSKIFFECKQVIDLSGWVVVLRNPDTGKIINSKASMDYLEKYVLRQLPEKAKFKSGYTQVKNKIIAKAKSRK